VAECSVGLGDPPHYLLNPPPESRRQSILVRVGGEHDFSTLCELAKIQLVVCSGIKLANFTNYLKQVAFLAGDFSLGVGIEKVLCVQHYVLNTVRHLCVFIV
jgi:hypothetical protein